VRERLVNEGTKGYTHRPRGPSGRQRGVTDRRVAVRSARGGEWAVDRPAVFWYFTKRA
jgi:hypothetical protein